MKQLAANSTEFQECAIGVDEIFFRALHQLTEDIQYDTGIKLYELYLCRASTKLCIIKDKRENDASNETN